MLDDAQGCDAGRLLPGGSSLGKSPLVGRDLVVRVANGESTEPAAPGHREYLFMYNHQDSPKLAEGRRA